MSDYAMLKEQPLRFVQGAQLTAGALTGARTVAGSGVSECLQTLSARVAAAPEISAGVGKILGTHRDVLSADVAPVNEGAAPAATLQAAVPFKPTKPRAWAGLPKGPGLGLN